MRSFGFLRHTFAALGFPCLQTGAPFTGGSAPAPAGTPDAPSLGNVSSGWSAGQNPPLWQSTYTNLEGYSSTTGAGDQVRVHWKLGAGAWTATAWEPLDDELATGDAVPWAFLTDGSLTAGGVFQVWEEIVRDLGLPTEATSAASNTWTDTISAVASETPSGWETVTGTSKSTYVTTSGGPPALVFHAQDGFNNAPISARSTANRAGERQWQLTITGSQQYALCWMGVDDGTSDFNTGFVRPGYSNSSGISMSFCPAYGWAIYAAGSTTPVQSGTFPDTSSMEGHIFTCVFGTVAHTITFYHTYGGTTDQLGTPVTLPTFASYFANVGGEGSAVQTAIFGSGQARTLDSGADYYDK